MRIAVHFALTAVLALCASATVAQDFDKGLSAYNAGDYQTAFNEWKPLAEEGDADAQFNLGLMYETGDGAARDYAEAIKWYRLAARQGISKAQNNLGVMYELGTGVLQNNVTAHTWYNIASANGNEKSAKWRDEIAANMTPEDISQAQAMASECISSGYENCGE